MRKVLLPILLFGVCLLVFATQKAGIFDKRYKAHVKTVYYPLGSETIPLKIQQYGKRTDLLFMGLHDDENTATDATKKILEKEGGMLIEIGNNEERNIRFRLGNTLYGIDPNRMFSEEGIIRSMDALGRTSKNAVNEVKMFAEGVLQLIPEKTTCIIALHNNTDGKFSAVSFSKGNKKAHDAEEVHINPELDADDFFLTTDRKIFDQLSEKNYNVILQQNVNPVEDGSLSVYCGKKGLRYVNVETEHGKMKVYDEMMKDLIQIMNK